MRTGRRSSEFRPRFPKTLVRQLSRTRPALQQLIPNPLYNPSFRIRSPNLSSESIYTVYTIALIRRTKLERFPSRVSDQKEKKNSSFAPSTAWSVFSQLDQRAASSLRNSPFL